MQLLAVDVTTCGGSGNLPRQQWLEIVFKDAPVCLHSIAFRNYYTSSISIMHSVARADGEAALHTRGRPPVWQTVLNKHVLMADPHYEVQSPPCQSFRCLFACTADLRDRSPTTVTHTTHLPLKSTSNFCFFGCDSGRRSGGAPPDERLFRKRVRHGSCHPPPYRLHPAIAHLDKL